MNRLKYIGVDEVARAKGHDYMTVMYDMLSGHLIGVETGRTAEVFSGFLKRLQSLRRHRDGMCNFAKHKLTSARIEAGNISIGMIRKKARGIRDTEYFKLKIRQSSMPDDQPMFYAIH